MHYRFDYFETLIRYVVVKSKTRVLDIERLVRKLKNHVKRSKMLRVNLSSLVAFE